MTTLCLILGTTIHALISSMPRDGECVWKEWIKCHNWLPWLKGSIFKNKFSQNVLLVNSLSILNASFMVSDWASKENREKNENLNMALKWGRRQGLTHQYLHMEAPSSPSRLWECSSMHWSVKARLTQISVFSSANLCRIVWKSEELLYTMTHFQPWWLKNDLPLKREVFMIK